MGDMSQQSLINDLKASLSAASEYFKAPANGDYIRHLDAAALDMSRIRARLRKGVVVLVPEQTEYIAPANIKRVTRTDWGRAERRQRKPWQGNYPSHLPRLSLIETDSGKKLQLSRPISSQEMADIGVNCVYFYEVPHHIDTDAALTTIDISDRGLLLLRAQVEACTELALRQIGKPITLRDGLGNQSRNATPAALAETMMRRWLNPTGSY